MAHIIVFGNEKGGTGKSTTAMHVLTALLRMGKKVGVIDLDLRQKSLARYMENRVAFVRSEKVDLPLASVMPIRATDPTADAALQGFEEAVMTLHPSTDFILIDCPGAHTPLSQYAHASADTLVSPLNDSFIDFDLLARIDPETGNLLGPSVYSEMVWEARQTRADAGAKPIDWIVIRNRLASQNMINKRKVGEALEDLSKRIGFRLVPGFADRVIFRELFPRGLTLLDLRDLGETRFTLSNIAARQEMRDLMTALKLPDVKVNF